MRMGTAAAVAAAWRMCAVCWRAAICRLLSRRVGTSWDGVSVEIAGLGLTRGHVCSIGGLARGAIEPFFMMHITIYVQALICLLRKERGVSYYNIIVNKQPNYRLFPFPNFSCHLFFAVTTGAGAEDEDEDSAVADVPPETKRIVLGVGCMYQP